MFRIFYVQCWRRQWHSTPVLCCINFGFLGLPEFQFLMLKSMKHPWLSWIHPLSAVIQKVPPNRNLGPRGQLAHLFSFSQNHALTIPFTIATKRIKYVGVNLCKETKELYTENYRTIMKEIKDDISRWRDSPCSWVGRINIVRMTILSNTIYRFNMLPIKLPKAFLIELKQKMSQFIWKHKRPRISKAVSRKRNGAWGINIPDFRL